MSTEKEVYDLKQTIRKQQVEIDQYKALVDKVQKLLKELVEG